MSAYGVVPQFMTTEDPWDNGQDVEHQAGHALRRDFTGYLSRVYYGMEVEERLAQLEEIDWRVWKAYTMKTRERRRVEDVAAKLRCSQATVYNLLTKAREYLSTGIREHGDYEAKLTMLEIQDPQALRVYVAMDAGYSQQQIADWMGVPLDTVKYASVKAQKFLGVHRRDVLVRRYKDLILAGT